MKKTVAKLAVNTLAAWLAGVAYESGREFGKKLAPGNVSGIVSGKFSMLGEKMSAVLDWLDKSSKKKDEQGRAGR